MLRDGIVIYYENKFPNIYFIFYCPFDYYKPYFWFAIRNSCMECNFFSGFSFCERPLYSANGVNFALCWKFSDMGYISEHTDRLFSQINNKKMTVRR